MNTNMNTNMHPDINGDSTSSQLSVVPAPVYHSQLFVRKDTPYTSLHQLQNATFAYNDETSLSGYHSLRIFIREYFLMHNSSTSGSNDTTHCCTNHDSDDEHMRSISLPFFRSVIRTGAHVKSVELVVNGGADVLCLDENIRFSLSQTRHGQHLLSQLREIPVPSLTDTIEHFNENNTTPRSNLRNPPSCQGISPIPNQYYEQRDCILSTKDGRLGPNPLQPVLVSNRLSPVLQQRIKNAFLDVQVTAEMKKNISVDCFVSIEQEQYDFIRYMLHEREVECSTLPPVLGPHLRANGESSLE
mmetsp:Transcript_19932/g.33600  ORF Transcript_19932/g.33600 Transcript_19932/m.33600 type:complete len:301 (-) Transcript_19932:258-1160(-)